LSDAVSILDQHGQPIERATYGGTREISTPEDWLRDVVTSRTTGASTWVTADRALTLPAYLQAIRVHANSFASQPIGVYRRLENGREYLPTHPINLILNAPHPWYTGFSFRAALIACAAMYGNGYALIERDGLAIRRLRIVHPYQIEPRVVKGELWYYYQQDHDIDGESTVKVLDPSEVLHVPGFSSDGICGVSMIRHAASAIGLGLAQQTFASGVFENDATIGVTISHPHTLKDKAVENLRDTLKQYRTGAKRGAFAPLILEEGMKVDRMAVPPEDAQMIEAGDFTVLQMCRATGTPPALLFVRDGNTWNNVESENLMWAQHGVLPWNRKFEEESDRKLFGPRRGAIYTHLSMDGILRADYKTRTEGDAKLATAGVLTPDEVREHYELNAHPGGIGAKPYIQGAMIPLEDAKKAEPPPPAPPPMPPQDDDSEPEEEPEEDRAAEAAAALRPVFADVSSRIIRREAATVSKMLSKGMSRTDYVEWLNRWCSDERHYIEAAFAAPLDAFASLASTNGAVSIELTAVLDSWHVDSIRRMKDLDSGDDFTTAAEPLPDALTDQVLGAAIAAMENAHA
jgi:HK97 family phage portal protein